jgi:hypothetical protein
VGLPVACCLLEEPATGGADPEARMDRYAVNLAAPPGHAVPALLQRFGDWLAVREYGALGWFSLRTEPVPTAWRPDVADRLRRDGFAFLRTPDGSLLALLLTGPNTPRAVVLLGSEGETDTVATSLEEFLVRLSRAETGIADLDEAGAGGQDALRAWLGEIQVQVPAAPSFDFDAYLDGGPTASPPPAAVAAEEAPGAVPWTPLLGTVIRLVGRRADDPEVKDFVTRVLGKKVPDSTTDANRTKNVTAPEQGIELAFAHDVKNEQYPLVRKSKSSYVPYLQVAWLTEKFGEPLPFGVRVGMTPEEITSRLGVAPRERGGARRLEWARAVDPARDVSLTVDKKSVAVEIDAAQELSSRHGVPPRPVVGLFVAWAVQRGLLNEPRLAEHAELLAAVRRRECRGSDLLDRAFPRGLWDTHLKDETGLRAFAFGWFHNIGGSFIRDDLVTVFGGRQGPYGHREAALDDDAWANVDRAAAALDARFAAWVQVAS